jgi:hypothetical protein
MPPWADITFHDLCARIVLRGGILYHDVFGHGPPGMVLVQSGLRWLVGWRSEALRAVDFVFVSLIFFMLLRVFLPGGTTTAARRWTALALYGFYFSTTEWCHCQSDTWMLLPSLTALCLRNRQVIDLGNDAVPGRRLALRAYAEGLCWGIAFLTKPFVALPALACWLVGAVLVIRTRKSVLGRLTLDLACVAAGGISIGLLGVAWLVSSGNWPYFIHGALGTWNQEYYQSSSGWVKRSLRLFYRFWPWGLIHLAAVPVAVILLWRMLRADAGRLRVRLMQGQGSQALLAAFYLAWLAQANFLQRQLLYQLVPPLFLALTLMAGSRRVRTALSVLARAKWLRRAVLLAGLVLIVPVAIVHFGSSLQRYLGWRVSGEGWDDFFAFLRDADRGRLAEQLHSTIVLPLLVCLVLLAACPPLIRGLSSLLRIHRVRRLVIALLLIWTLFQNPLLDADRLVLWDRCLYEGSTPEIRNALTLETDLVAPDWVALEQVKGYLEGQSVRNRELTCYALSAIHLYKEMNLKPSTRFILLWAALIFFPNHRAEIAQELKATPQRFIINDLRQTGLDKDEADVEIPGREQALPPAFFERQLHLHVPGVFPWQEPIVFRAKRYLVHRVRRPATSQQSAPPPGQRFEAVR